MYGDTAVIRRLAARMSEQGTEIRHDADRLVEASQQVLWEGRAARAMRERMTERAVALRRTADEHDDAARALRRHADEVDRLKDLIREIARRVQGLVEGACARLASLADTALDRVTRQLPTGTTAAALTLTEVEAQLTPRIADALSDERGDGASC